MSVASEIGTSIAAAPLQKILNDPHALVDEMLEGVLLAHPSLLKSGGEPRTIMRADAPVSGKVAIVTGGGSGHLPLFLGYVGRGLADGAAIGDVFAAPSARTILAATRAVNGSNQVLYLYGNYSGDVMNFDFAAEQARSEGITVATVLASDDVASAPKGEEEHRRGIAGLFFLYKLAGACAEQGASLAELQETVGRAAARVRSIGVALAPCVVPAAGRPTFELPAGEMEIGMGIHGEPGIRRGRLERAERIAELMVKSLLDDLPYEESEEAAVLVNGLGATAREELYILYRTVHRLLETRGVHVRRSWVGEYATSLEMAGASLSLLKLDEELAALLDLPAESPFFLQR